jgi:long-chain fatty acid transport protein
MRVRSGALVGLGVAVVLASGPARAGGLYINEFPTLAMGTAGAGAQAMADTAATAWYNPAGMTRIEGHSLLGGFGGVVSDIQFDPNSDTPVPGNDGGQQGGFAPVMGAYYVHSLSERWKLGADLNAISGAVLDPDNDWTGRLQNQETSILIMELGLEVAFRVNDWFSIGAGPRFQYSMLDYTVSSPRGIQINFDQIDDFLVTWKAGLLFEPSERTRIGFLFFGKSEPDFSGDVKFRPTPIEADVNTKIVLPRAVRGSVYHELNDAWALMATVGWEQWSDFPSQYVSIGPGSGNIPRNLDDTYYFGLGVHWRPVDRWLLTAGAAYDTNPASRQDRTADMPLDRQIRGAFGAYYDYSENLQVGGAFTYANYGKAAISNSTLRGDFDRNDLYFFTVVFNWKKTAWSD